MTLEELELLTDIRDFTTLFYVILRRESSEWLESSIESDLDMRIAIWSLHLAFHDFAFFDTLSSVRTGQLKNLLLAYIRDPLFFPFVKRAKDPLYDPLHSFAARLSIFRFAFISHWNGREISVACDI